MESDHKSDYKDGLSTNRKGARSARPRLADLLESVTVPDEIPATRSSDVNSSVTNGATRSDFDGGTQSNGEWSSSSLGSSMDASVASSTTVPPSTGVHYNGSSQNGESKVNTAAFADTDSSDDDLSTAAQAAKERRRSLYARRTDAGNIHHDPQDLSTPHNGQSNDGQSNNGQRNGQNQDDKQGYEVGSLADRLFGERQPLADSTTGQSAIPDQPSLESPLDNLSPSASFTGSADVPTSDRTDRERTVGQESATDWAAKFSPDAPLPSLPDLSSLSSRMTATDQNAQTQNGSAQAEPAELGSSYDRSTSFGRLDSSSLESSSLESSSLDSGSLRPDDLDANRETSMKMSEQTPADQSRPAMQPTTRRYDTTKPSASELADPVNIKGRSDGVWIELGQGKWADVLEALSQRLVQSTGFFRGGQVTLDVGVRPLQESELREISALTEQHGLTLTSVRSRSEQSCQVALAAGLAASLDAPDGLLAQPALSNYEKLEHFVYRGNLRSGQILRRAETILVLGDVNPGSQIISDSDILVWGRLRGIAHAGASGDTSSVIAALLMEPTQIRVADAIAILPEQEVKTSITERLAGGNTSPNGTRRPEIAHAIGEDIIVDMWDESKPGGIMAFRRSL